MRLSEMTGCFCLQNLSPSSRQQQSGLFGHGRYRHLHDTERSGGDFLQGYGDTVEREVAHHLHCARRKSVARELRLKGSVRVEAITPKPLLRPLALQKSYTGTGGEDIEIGAVGHFGTGDHQGGAADQALRLVHHVQGRTCQAEQRDNALPIHTRRFTRLGSAKRSVRPRASSRPARPCRRHGGQGPHHRSTG